MRVQSVPFWSQERDSGCHFDSAYVTRLVLTFLLAAQVEVHHVHETGPPDFSDWFRARTLQLGRVPEDGNVV